MNELSSLVDAYIQLSAEWSGHSKGEPKTYNSIMTENLSRLSKIQMAFLELLHEMLNLTFNGSESPDDTSQETAAVSVFLKVFNFIWIPNLPPTLLKKCLTIVNSVFDHLLDHHKMQMKATGDNEACGINHHQADGVSIATDEVMTRITGGEWLDDLTYRDAEHGFGGTDITSCDGDDDDDDGCYGDFCQGDHPLLRQVVTLGMSACIMVLKRRSDEGQ